MVLAVKLAKTSDKIFLSRIAHKKYFSINKKSKMTNATPP